MSNKEKVKETPEQAVLPKEERDKHRALLAGVVFFMILIVFLWIINLGNVLKPSAIKEKNSFDVDKFSEEFQQSFNEVGAKMEELKQISPELLNSLPTTTAATKK
jgi:hypothetical protein